MSVLDFIREDLRNFSGYLSARKQNSAGDIWLNANESAQAHAFDNLQLNRYPEPQPQLLQAAISDYYGISGSEFLLTRGSDEAIDVLIRATCMPGKDCIAIQSPTFGMYAVCARLHACQVIDSPLNNNGNAFEWDIPAMIASTLIAECKLLFLCSPANPTGQSLSTQALEMLLVALQGRCLVVVDEAYGEYSANPSALNLLKRFNNLAVLKTLSKAHALAGARIGLVAADESLVRVLKACQAPYPISKPSAALAVQAFNLESRQRTHQLVAECIQERERVSKKLTQLSIVQAVYESDANFLLVKFDHAEPLNAFLLERGLVVRAMTQYPALAQCLRISIGTREENNALLLALQQYCELNHA